jgi:hypothetical protein
MGRDAWSESRLYGAPSGTLRFADDPIPSAHDEELRTATALLAKRQVLCHRMAADGRK